MYLPPDAESGPLGRGRRGATTGQAAAADPHAALVPTYQADAIHPEIFVDELLEKGNLADYGECLDVAGSLWAFVASALPD